VQDYLVPDHRALKGSTQIHQAKVAKGKAGVKAGRGCLDWPPGKADQVRTRRDAFLIQFLRWQKEKCFP
jgi:hypothetical protein